MSRGRSLGGGGDLGDVEAGAAPGPRVLFATDHGRRQPQLLARPWWASALAVFCLSTLLLLAVRDLFVPEARNVEVWLGFELHGSLAMATAPIHWAIFGVGAWGFWRVRPWIWPWASAYAFAIALSHVIWSAFSPAGPGLETGLLYGVGLAIPAIALLWARPPR